MSEFEIAELGAGEAEMTAGEFSRAMEAEIEATLEEAVSQAASKAVSEIKIKFPKADTEGISAAIETKLPDIRETIKTDIHLQSELQLEVSTGEIVSDFDKKLSKTTVENMPMEELSQKVINDAVMGEDGIPNKDNLTDENIAKSSEKIVKEEVEFIQKETAKGLEKSGGDLYERQIKESGGKVDPEAKAVVESASGDMVKPEARANVVELSGEIEGTKPSEDPNVQEGRSLRDKIVERWKATNFKAGFSNLLKLAAVVAAIMMLTKGGRKILEGGADAIGDAAAGAVDTIGDLAERIFGPLFDVLKNLLKSLKKWAIYALIFLLVAGLIYFLVKLILSRLLFGNGEKTVKVEMTPNHS